MTRFLLLALGALSVIKMDGIYAQDVPDCVPGCSNQTRGEFAEFSCASADDAVCLCAAPNFFYGVRDCAPACANDAQVYSFLMTSFCQGQTIPYTPTAAPPRSTAPPTTTISISEPLITPGPPTSAPTEVPTSLPPTAEAPSVTSGPPTTEAAAATGITSAPTAAPTSSQPTTAEASAPPTTLSTSTSPSSASASSEAAGDESPEAGKPSSKSGLSSGAAAGIGVGVALGVLAVAGVAGFLAMRNRKRASAQSIDISQPSSGNDHRYPGQDQGPFEKYANDIEMVANRYEDMVPRTQPRTLV